MESTCAPGKVQVSETTFAPLRGQFQAKSVGQQVKGIGLMGTFVLDGETWDPKSSPSSSSSSIQ